MTMLQLETMFEVFIGGVEKLFSVISGKKCNFRGNPKAKANRMISLTFDDGPSEETRNILQSLKSVSPAGHKKTRTRATFFWLADEAEKLVERNPKLFKEIIDTIKKRGCEIGLHGDFRKKTQGPTARVFGQIDEERMKADKEKLEKLVGIKIKVVRPHYWQIGPILKAFTEAAERLKMKTAMLTLAVGTNAIGPPVKQIDQISKRARSAYIIDIHENLGKFEKGPIVYVLVENLRNLGFQLVTISELLS